mgnify:CR=1 FL=1
MCKAMNRSFISVILGGFGGETAAAGGGSGEQKPAKLGSADDAAFIMKNASKVIIVPGYGMAVAQAQYPVADLTKRLRERGVEASDIDEQPWGRFVHFADPDGNVLSLSQG